MHGIGHSWVKTENVKSKLFYNCHNSTLTSMQTTSVCNTVCSSAMTLIHHRYQIHAQHWTLMDENRKCQIKAVLQLTQFNTYTVAFSNWLNRCNIISTDPAFSNNKISYTALKHTQVHMNRTLNDLVSDVSNRFIISCIIVNVHVHNGRGSSRCLWLRRQLLRLHCIVDWKRQSVVGMGARKRPRQSHWGVGDTPCDDWRGHQDHLWGR
jgi:hypothetical protein